MDEEFRVSFTVVSETNQEKLVRERGMIEHVAHADQDEDEIDDPSGDESNNLSHLTPGFSMGEKKGKIVSNI